MKKLIYLAGLIAPGFATKAIAQEMRLPPFKLPDRFYSNDELYAGLSQKEEESVHLYQNCTIHERAVFLWKVLATSQEASSQTNQLVLQNRVNEILKLPEDQQVVAMINEIRRGGMRWGSIGDPTTGCH